MLFFYILSAVVYDSYVSAQKPRVYGSLHCCERKNWNNTGANSDPRHYCSHTSKKNCTGGNEVCKIKVTTTNDRWECVPAMYEKTDYPLREENGENWRPFWWYNATAGVWPSDENDTLVAQFGLCNPAAHYCFGRLPLDLLEDETELLAVDSAGNKFRWAFNSGNPTAHAVWLAFHDHQQFVYEDVKNSDNWAPIVVAGGPCHEIQDSFMYHSEHGVASFMLDDDNCDCFSTLNAGHAMCSWGFNSDFGVENVYGVGLLNEGGCVSKASNGPSETNSLFLYYRVPSPLKKK